MAGRLQECVRNYQETSEGIAHEFRLSVGEAIIEGLREKGWNQKKLAARLGVTEPLISRLLNGDHNWTSESVGKIGFALDIRFRAKKMPLRSMVQETCTPIVEKAPTLELTMASSSVPGVFRMEDYTSGQNSAIKIKASATAL